MTFKTIRCALTASEETRKLFWEWMEKYTLLVSELLDKIGNSPDFSTWQEKREITQDQVEIVLKTLKNHQTKKALKATQNVEKINFVTLIVFIFIAPLILIY